ncbi:Receptor-like serine/threonine-protein kinase [Melia azedarach]|uniref:Receptor-like serine/threonine-protein kinase n=1 Tax=Melia azedarach TaxID=155640 RepID=A0ACC1Y571_MELAZ|nr:Receptor-like serine/threonine-protein kinase [Melia azedarach]
MDAFALFMIILIGLVSLVSLILALTISAPAAIFFGLSASLVVVDICGLIIYCVKRKPKNKGKDLMRFDLGTSLKVGNMELTERNESVKGRKKEVELPQFSFASVSTATDNFSAANKLGEGGFGPVYKGVLLKGDEIAVKRLSGRSGQGLEELKNEATVIAKVQHKNLVRLLGCCIDKDEKILVYEYMPNKSLDFFLFDPTKCGLLNWGTRVQIIEGIAQGLLYLHQYSRVRIIHRDLKASNILLDKHLNPKISDFGMARIIFGENDLEGNNTSRIAGTYGYMSPEYALEGMFSIKSDVFSFGVLLLEILSSKKNTGFYQTGSLNLLGYAWDLWTSNKVLELIDPMLLEEASSKQITSRYVNIALLCAQEIAEDRPTMSDVVSMLTNEVVPLLPPKQPAFSHVGNTILRSTSPTSRPEICSINEVTISLLEAR